MGQKFNPWSREFLDFCVGLWEKVSFEERQPTHRGPTLNMPLPDQSVTLTPGQIADLNEKLSELRHNVNNHLSLIVASAELVRRKPELAERFLDALFDQPEKISLEIRAFSDTVEQALGITQL